MQIPVQVRFHGFPASEALEREAHRWASHLEKVFPGVVSCRISIELPHQHQQQGRRFRVQVDLGVPGRHLVATTDDTEPGCEDAYVALRNAFRAVRRQLGDHAGQGRESTPEPALGS